MLKIPIPTDPGKSERRHKLSGMRDEIATSYIVMKRIIREYYKKLLANKFDNLHEMEKFLDTLPKLLRRNR